MERVRKHKICEKNSYSCKLCSQIPARLLVILGTWIRKKWYGTYCDKTDGEWDKIAERMMLNFAESGHPIFHATSAFERGELRSKENGKKSIHFNGSEENIELILRTIISANQLRVYGAVETLCKELSKYSRASGKLDANEYLETMEIPTEPPIADTHTDGKLQGNLLLNYERILEQLSDHQKLPKLCSDAGLKSVEQGQFFITLDAEKGPNEMKNLCREDTQSRNEKASRAKGWRKGNRKICPVMDAKVCLHQERYGIEILIESLFRDGTASWVRNVNGINKYVTETTETIP